ncbi:hypothetical protein Hanom_Chr10g00966991 [Helianthus anomalus]
MWHYGAFFDQSPISKLYLSNNNFLWFCFYLILLHHNVHIITTCILEKNASLLTGLPHEGQRPRMGHYSPFFLMIETITSS